jgi:hypothetical protein
MIYKFKKHEIEIYDSIQNLPILRFQKFNKYQMIASDIGCDFSDYEQRTKKALAFLQKNMVPEAMQELSNRRQLVFNAFNESNPNSRSFAVLVKRIDKQKFVEYAPNDLDLIMQKLNDIGFDYESMFGQLIEVKKKIELELQVYYKNFFPKNSNDEILALRVKRMNLLCDEIITETEVEKPLFEVEKEILENDKPNKWDVWADNNMERILEVDFQKFALNVTELSGLKLKETSTFTFYASVEYLKEKNPKKQNYE